MHERGERDPGEPGPGPGTGGPAGEAEASRPAEPVAPSSPPEPESGEAQAAEPESGAGKAQAAEEVPEPTPAAEPAPPAKPRYFASLRYARIRLRGTFESESPHLDEGDWVLVQSPRGVEQAQVLTRLRTVPDSPGLPPEEEEVSGRILRRLRPEEVVSPWLQSGRFTPEFETAEEMIRSLNLPMKLTDVEVLPRRDKAVFYFLADGRVDFRQLVRNLARALRLRVEMKQIGVRDEARLKGTCGHCGMSLCCSSWIRKMEPVNMKMAKAQKTTLDPDKISGRCGRLLCCLRYEEQVYTEHRKILPYRGTRVMTPDGPGKVVQQEILKCRVTVYLDKGETGNFCGNEIRRIEEGGPEPERPVRRETATAPPPPAPADNPAVPAPFAEELLGGGQEKPAPARKKRRRKRRRPKPDKKDG